MSNTKAVDDILSATEAFSDDDGPQCARISAKEMMRLEKERDEKNRRLKERDETIKFVSDATSAIVFFH
jgi:hypothetical protein